MNIFFAKKTSAPLKRQSLEKKNLRSNSLLIFVACFLIILLLNILGSFFYLRLDLTAEKRYTLAPSTKKLLKEADDILYFKIYLEGDFPADFKRLRNETKEMLSQFRAYNKNIEFEFVNPNSIQDPAEQKAFYRSLIEKGVQPTQISQRTKEGASQILLFPTAEVVYKNKSSFAQLLLSQRYTPEDELLNNSIQNLEYTLSDAIRKVMSSSRPKIGFIYGQENLPREQLNDIQIALSEYYNVDNIELGEKINSLTERKPHPKDSTNIFFRNKYDALVIAKPNAAFSDKDLFLIDQFIMRGGKVLWLVDGLKIAMDSLEKQDEAIATRNELNVDRLLFKYGVRVNPNLILDMRNVPIPMAVGSIGGKPQISFVPWYYFPEIVPRSTHPIVKNLNSIKTEFVSSIDTIESPLKKTILLTSSEYSRVANAPAIVSLQIAREEPDPRLFNKKYLPIAVLLEGSFPSAFKSRLDPELTDNPEIGFLEESSPTKMIVISDGDMIKNQYNYKESYSYPLGYDSYSKQMFGNKDFLLNCMNFLCDDEDFLFTRSREVKMRKLNMVSVKERERTIQLFNLLSPILLVSLFAVLYNLYRKRKYTRNK